jgi:hypothetical protein
MKLRNCIKPAVLATALTLAGSGSAWSANVFTFDPSAVGLAPAVTAFTADTLTLADNATLTIDSAGNAVESGVFYIASAALAGNPVSTPGLNSTYGIYGTFSATGTGSFNNTNLSTFNYTLWGDPGHNTTFTLGGGVNAGTNATDIQLAHGSLIPPGTGQVVGPPFNLALQIMNSLIVDNAAFFVSPTPFYFKIASSFTAFGGQISPSANCPPGPGQTCTFVITSGGGTASFVPEPETLALLGIGLIGLGGARRRKLGATGV